jgi:hypothetical protein
MGSLSGRRRINEKRNSGGEELGCVFYGLEIYIQTRRGKRDLSVEARRGFHCFSLLLM